MAGKRKSERKKEIERAGREKESDEVEGKGKRGKIGKGDGKR